MSFSRFPDQLDSCVFVDLQLFVFRLEANSKQSGEDV